MKYANSLLIAVIVLGAVTGWGKQLGTSVTKVTVRVVDESNQPVTNAHIRVDFDNLKTTNPWDGSTPITRRGETDKKGEFYAAAKSIGRVGIDAQKEGYYISGSEHIFHTDEKGFLQKWDAAIDLQLRKKVAPVAMYAKDFNPIGLTLPADQVPVGYDLIAGDWLPPYGKGLTNDLVFTLHRENQGSTWTKWDMSIKTTNDGDGFNPIPITQETPQSKLHFPRYAPTDNYSCRELLLAAKMTGIQSFRRTNSPPDANFFFRVRAKVDEKGGVTQALYGKLIGPVSIFIHGTNNAKLEFKYYLNPEPNSRNMEYDPKQNLFLMAADKDVKKLEEERHKLWVEKQQRPDEAGEKAIQDANIARRALELSCEGLPP